jgi:hypothetical protein
MLLHSLSPTLHERAPSRAPPLSGVEDVEVGSSANSIGVFSPSSNIVRSHATPFRRLGGEHKREPRDVSRRGVSPAAMEQEE